ncbi:MAG: type IV secretion system DNA-binding domain-containing protein [Dehalococcoidia bacterium]|nr:type IV secretion system DNA-binding domain-containing protein [Dehalococcoidia bacterium]
MRRWSFGSRPSLTLGTYGPSLLRRPFKLGASGIAAHKHGIGLTGQGKSKFLASLFVQLFRQGVGCALIDPHADLANDILGALADAGHFATPDARERLYFIDFGQSGRYVPFNVLRQPYDDHTVAKNVVEACKRAWPALADGAAPQFENILLAGAFVLIQNGLPLTALPRLLSDGPYRGQLLLHVTDGDVVDFFRGRFDRWGKDTPLMVESTLRRVFLLTFSPALKGALGQEDNLLNFRELMDAGVSIIFNLGGLDEDTQRLLGCLITVGFEVAALSRAEIPEEQRRQYHLIIDEFSQFSAQSEESLARVLSLARKYGLYLTLAHQTWSQVNARLQGALQNAVTVAFKLGRSDAEWAAPRFGRFDPYALKHEVADPTQIERTHPVYFNLQEAVEGWTQSLMDLKPREAYVRVGQRTVRVKSPTFPRPRCSKDELRAVTAHYAQAFLRSAPLDVHAASDQRTRRRVALDDAEGPVH